MTCQSRPHRHARSRALALACAGAAALVLAACSSSGSPSGGTSSTSGGGGTTSTSGGGSGELDTAKADLAKYTGSVSAFPPIADIPGGVSSLKGKTVWYVPIGSSVPVLAAFGTGIEQALHTLGINYHVCDGKFIPPSIAACLSQAQTQGADAVITNAIDYQLVRTAFDNLVSHHIPVLIAGEKPSGGKTSSPQLAFGDTSQVVNLLEKLVMQRVLVDSGGKAHILYIVPTDSALTIGGAAAGKAYVTQSCKACTVTQLNYQTASIARVGTQVSSALISHPDTNYVVSGFDAAGGLAVQGIQTAGYANKVKLYGANGDLAALQRIKGGVQVADVGASPLYSGWQLADAILRMLKGQVPQLGPSLVRVFDKSNIGPLQLSPAGYASIDWYSTNAFKATFLKAWGAS